MHNSLYNIKTKTFSFLVLILHRFIILLIYVAIWTVDEKDEKG